MEMLLRCILGAVFLPASAAAFDLPSIGTVPTPSTPVDHCGDNVNMDPSVADVVSFNLYWWCVSGTQRCGFNADGRGFQKLYERIWKNQPFDLIGFQECDNLEQIVENSGYASCLDYYKPPVVEGADGGMAWNNRKYTLLKKGSELAGIDKYGKRRINWVRLAVNGGGTVFFANTHGPLFECDGPAGIAVGDAYLKAIRDNMQQGDHLIFTGDFNCGSATSTVQRVNAELHNAITGNSYGGADHIFTNGLQVLSSAAVDGEPSDHNLVKASFRLPVPPSSPNFIITTLFLLGAAAVVVAGGAYVWLRRPDLIKQKIDKMDIEGKVVEGIRAARRSNPFSSPGVREPRQRLMSPSPSPSPEKDGDTETGARELKVSMRSLASAMEEAASVVMEKVKVAPKVEPPEQTSGSAALKAACVVGCEVEVFSQSAGRWFLAEVVDVNGDWITVEYQGRRNSLNLSSPEIHRLLCIAPDLA
eukprot:TRINITY_DN92585_c0_g1_i1.p1 TRINITY_DN92585_c0_g1~~TRINITY_DN92585_c0_g1_i1.p1  ORF type:complete len:474 (-),score=91.69 TRINITY_DN92585_c0_g1_i1:149-1570(-)